MEDRAKIRDYLQGLNEAQLAAVQHDGSALLILAGAGSGKTRVITTKIAYLVREKGVAPESILAVTFTNKAAQEMRERAIAIDERCGRAVIRTFHSFGAYFLRRRAQAAQTVMPWLSPNFLIYDDDDQVTLLHGQLPEHDRKECARFISQISRAKDYGLAPDDAQIDDFFANKELKKIYAIYENKLRSTGNVDFGDLISLPTRLLREDKAIREATQARFRIILVDEYQDSNVAQFELLQMLSGLQLKSEKQTSDTELNFTEQKKSVLDVYRSARGPAYVCVVGDDDQSIYRFRGAEVQNILSFADYFPQADIIKLEQNYRSYQNILDVAGDVVSNNQGRLGKELQAMRGEGPRPELHLLGDHDDEVKFCIDTIKAHITQGGNYNDIAILYRTNAQSLNFEREFTRQHLPYTLVGALRFYEREEIKDVLAYLALIANERDEVAYRRIVNKPARSIGQTSVDFILERTANYGGNILLASKKEAYNLRGKARGALANFVQAIENWNDLIFNSTQVQENKNTEELIEVTQKKNKSKGEIKLSEFIISILQETGLNQYHREQDEVTGTQKESNLNELVNSASRYEYSREGLVQFLEDIELDRELVRSANEDGVPKDAVTLITMHNTKGLEFPMVIITGLEHGLFPREDDNPEQLEEERRLFYVAITRARNNLYLTSCRTRLIYGKTFDCVPSSFLGEIDAEHVTLRGAEIRSRYASEGAGYGARYGQRKAVAAPTTQSKWRVGIEVYHEDYGTGAIVQVKESADGAPLVFVRFETGKMAQFFPQYTSKLEIV